MYGTINDALMDAATNTIKRANISKKKPSGIQEVYGAGGAGRADMAVLQSDWMDPRSTKFHWKEQTKVALYNSTNLPVYITINRKKLRRSHDSAITGYPKSLLETFPQSYTQTNQTGNATFLEWTPANNLTQYEASAIPTGGTSAALVVPRQFGAWVERLPYEPRPVFSQARPENLFNLASSQYDVTATANDQLAPGAKTGFTAMGSISFIPATHTYQPTLATNYFVNRINQAAWNGSTFNGNNAYTGVQWNTDDAYDQVSHQLQETITGTTAANPGGAAYTSVDFSAAKQYTEARNKVMRKLFHMREKRYTIQPGRVLRLKFTTKRHCLTGTTLMRLKGLSTPWFGLTGSGGNTAQNIGRTLEAWSFGTYLPQHGGAKSGYQEEWLSIAMRGPHLPDSTTSNSLNTAPANLTIKLDHSVFTKLVAKDVRLKGHRTILDTNLQPSAANMRVMFQNPTLVSGTGTLAAPTAPQAPQATRPY